MKFPMLIPVKAVSLGRVREKIRGWGPKRIFAPHALEQFEQIVHYIAQSDLDATIA
jgi:hypothetical protein